MADTVLIIAYHAACLIPVFGESALSRLARLAASLTDKVELWIAPEVHREMGRDFQELPAGISFQVLRPQDMASAALTSSASRQVVLLPGHSVWDRLILKEALNAEAGATAGAARDFVRPAPEVPAVVQTWVSGSNLPSSARGESLPFVLRHLADAPEAEGVLVANLASATQASDGLMARLVDRRVSRRLSPPLARRRVPPNAITLFSMSIGLLGGWLLAQVGYWLHLAGAMLFLTAVVLDGVDGEVARLTIRESDFGHYLDIITDNLVHAAIFTGIALGLYRESGYVGHLYALAALLLGFVLSALVVYQVVEKRDRSREPWNPVAVRWIGTLNSRDFAYLIVFLALVDRLAWFLWASAFGAYIFAVGILLLPRYYRAQSS